jgi:outer membrane protein TolC
MKAARAGLRAFESKLSQASWAYAPKLQLEAGIAPVPTITGNALKSEIDSGTWGFFGTAKLSMVQPVYTFGKIASLKRAARHGVSIGQSLVDAARFEIRHRLAQSWHGALLAAELDVILSEGKRWLERAQDRMDELKKADSDDYNQNEALRLQTRMAEFYAMEAENNQLRLGSLVGLRILLSLPRGTTLQLAAEGLEPLQLKLQSADDYWAIARQNEPILRAARSEEAAKWALGDHQEAKLWPDLVIIAEASAAMSDVVEDQRSSFATDPYNFAGAAALIGIRWNLDIPTTLGRVSEANAQAMRARFTFETKEDLLELRVRQLHQSLLDKGRLIGIYRKSQKAAQGWLLSAWELYEDGFGDFRMVMEALVQFYGKKVAYLKTVFQHNVTVAELSQAIGVEVTSLEPGPSHGTARRP